MVMNSGERWHCTNASCRCSVLVEITIEIEGSNPRCTCGGDMKKVYSPPVFRYLNLRHFPEPALALRDSVVE